MDMSYATAFFEAEGSVSIVPVRWHGKIRQIQLRVCVTNTQLKALKKLHALIGFGSIQGKKRPNRVRTIYYWVALAGNARRFLEMVLPFCEYKADQVALGIEFQRHIESRKYGGRGSKGKTPRDVMAYRIACIHRMRHLNCPPGTCHHKKSHVALV